MTRNHWIAVILAFVVAAICAVAGVLVVIFPAETLKRFDSAWLRGILFLVAFLLSLFIGIELYYLWHDPPPLRMYRHIIVYVMGVGASASAAPFGLFGLQQFQGFGVTITLQEAGIASAITAAASFAALCVLAKFYHNCHNQGVHLAGSMVNTAS